MNERAHQQLVAIADAAVKDIRNDIIASYGEDAVKPGDGEYDIYMEMLPFKRGNTLCAVIDIGDWYQQAYYWLGDEWVIHPEDPGTLKTAIIKYRLARSF